MNRSKPAYPLQPPRERGTGRAFALALLMHVLLGIFLYHGIHWQNSTPAGAEAELWTEVPEQPAPTPAPAPPPPAAVAPAPPIAQEQADIALQEKKREQQEAAARAALLAEQQRQQQLAEQEAQAQRQRALERQQAELAAQKAAAVAAAAQLKQQQQQQHAEQLQQQLAEQQKLEQQKLEQQKQEQLKQQQLVAQKKAAEAEKAAKAQALAEQQARQKQLDQDRRMRLAQLQGVAGESSTGQGLAKSGTGSGSGGTANSPGYADKVKRRVRPNIVWAGETQGLETVIAVHCAATGTLLSATIEHSSGNPQWDDAALRAVQKSDPMPLDDNGKTPASFMITMRPAG